MIKQLRVMVVVVTLISFQVALEGCSTVNVIAKQASKADDIKKTTVCALWWGGGDPVISADCNGNGMQIVSTSSNWLYSLCTVVTLGAVVPMDIQYRCTSEPMQNGGTLGN